MPVIKATSTRTSKNNIQWWKILPSSDKEITPLKSSWSLGYNLRKRIVLQRRIVLVLLTAVDLRQTILYAAWPDNICLESPSLPPKGFQRVLLVSITVFVSSMFIFFSNTSCSKISVTLDQDDLPASITWQKERARTVLISEFPAPSPAINTNLLRQFRLSKLEERMNKNKQHKVGRRKDPISTTITLCWYFLFFSLLHEDGFFGFVLVSRWVQVHNIHGIIMFLLVTRNFLPLCPV